MKPPNHILMLEAMHCFRQRSWVEWSVEQLKPLLFFKELLFSPLQSSRGRFLQGLYAAYEPADESDWLEWAQSLFALETNVHAVARAADEIKLEEIAIWIMLPYPLPGNETDNKIRIERLYEWVNQVMTLWQTILKGSRLVLKGFVWGRESLPEFDHAVIKACNEHIAALELERLWLANYRSAYILQREALAFSKVAVYPNYTGNSEYGKEWLDHAARFSALNGLGIQMAYGNGQLHSPSHFKDYLHYKRAYSKLGGSGPIVYRFPGHSLFELFERDKEGYHQVAES